MFRKFFHILPRSVRDLLSTRYRPERHYMRGSGPASAARLSAGRSTS